MCAGRIGHGRLGVSCRGHSEVDAPGSGIAVELGNGRGRALARSSRLAGETQGPARPLLLAAMR
jgi:hypothetical protein